MQKEAQNTKKRKLGETSFASNQPRVRYFPPPHQGDLRSFLERLIDVKIGKSQIAKRPIHKFRISHPFSLSKQAQVIYLRHKSLRSPSLNWHTAREVFERTGISHGAQYNILHRWRKAGFIIKSGLGNRGSKKMLSQEQQRTLANPSLLRDWSHLGLHSRAQKIRQMFNLKSFSHQTLADYYQRLGVKYRKPHFEYRHKEDHQARIHNLQQAFGKELGMHMLAREAEIIYIDETTFNLWQTPSRCWVSEGMSLTLSNQRGPSLTLIGALSDQRGLLYHNIVVGSNNAVTFAKFLANLKQRALRKTLIVMDNLSVHKSKQVLSLFDDRFKRFFLPPYSCTLNPIERLWSVVKSEWRRKQHLYSEQLSEDEENRKRCLIERLEGILEKVNLEKAQSIARSHVPYLLKCLDGLLV